MKILLHSRFFPSVGGVETVASLLSYEWLKSGLQLTVVSDVADDLTRREKFDFPIYYRPSSAGLVRLVRSHDIFVHFNVSLRAVWPLLLAYRPLVVSHHGFYIVDRTGKRDWREKLKLRLARRASANIAATKAIEREIGVKCVVIPNPYDAKIFCDGTHRSRNGDLIFVGRLVSDKGVDLLLKALSIVTSRGIRARLTIVGDGPEREILTKIGRELNVDKQMRFVGQKSQSEVAEELRNHKILVIPSVIAEGFGVVAVEGIASGCAVVGSATGGLPEAIGPCGITFANGDANDLANKIRFILTDGAVRGEFQKHAVEHLSRHQPGVVAKQYLDVFNGVLGVRRYPNGKL